MFSMHRAFRNLTAIFFGDVFGKMLAMATAVILARYLGPEDYGKHAFIISFTYLFMVMADFGLNDLIIRDVARDHSLSSHYFSASLVIKAGLSICSILVMYIAMHIIGYSRELILYTMLFSGFVVLITFTNSITALFKALEHMEYASLLTVLNSLLLVAFVGALAFFKGSLLEIILARVLAAFVVALCGFMLLSHTVVSLKFSTTAAHIRKVAGAAFPFLTIGIVNTLYFSLDVIMLSRIKGPEYVGWFTPAANDLFFGLLIIPGAISTVTYPMFSRHYGESADQLGKTCNFTIKVLTIMGVAISAGTFVLAPRIIRFIYGDKYEESVIVLRIVSLAVSFMFARDPVGYALSAIGRVKTLMWLNVGFLALNAMLNLFFIPRYAHVGAAMTTVVCTFLSIFAGKYFLGREVRNITILTNFPKPLIAAGIMCLFLLATQDAHLLVQIALGAAVYFWAIMALRAFDSDELEMLKRLIVRTTPTAVAPERIA